MDATPVKSAKPALAGAALAGAAAPASGRASFGRRSTDAASLKFAALHEAAGAVSLLAGYANPVTTPDLYTFSAALRDVPAWRRERIEQGIEDLLAVMEPGLAALLAIHARGADARPAARALWEEFRSGRNAVMALIPQASGPHPARPA